MWIKKETGSTKKDWVIYKTIVFLRKKKKSACEN